MVREAGGNPLFLRELARAGGAPGTGLPGTLVAAVAGELARLPAAARRLAEGAAVAGDPFDLDVAAAAAGQVPPDPAALDALAAAGLVGASGEGREFAFRHALVRRAVYDAAPPAWRLAAHERAARALARRGAPVAVRAYHVTRFARPGDERAIALLAEAAAGSRDTAPAAAAHWYGAAARLLPDADDRRGSLLARRALALAEAGRLEQSEAALLEALALAGAAPGAERARLETACARVQAQLGRHAEARHRLRAAFARCGGTAAAEVALHLAADAMSRDRPGELRTWAGHVARSAGDGRPMLQAAAQALTALARILDGDDDRGPEVAAFDRAVARMDALDDATVAADLEAALQIGRAQLRLQRAAGAAATFTRALDVCRRAHRGELVVHLLAVRTIARWLLLDLDGALADATAVEEGARLYGGSHQVLLATWLLALVHHHRGEAAQAERAAGAFTALAASLPPCEPVRAGACTLATIPVDRDPERCVREILELAGADLEHAEHGWAGSALPALVRAALATGRTEEAEQLGRAGDRTHARPARERGARRARPRGSPARARRRGRRRRARHPRRRAAADAIPAPLDAAEARLLAGRALAAAGRAEEAKRALQRVAADAGRGGAGACTTRPPASCGASAPASPAPAAASPTQPLSRARAEDRRPRRRRAARTRRSPRRSSSARRRSRTRSRASTPSSASASGGSCRGRSPRHRPDSGPDRPGAGAAAIATCRRLGSPAHGDRRPAPTRHADRRRGRPGRGGVRSRPAGAHRARTSAATSTTAASPAGWSPSSRGGRVVHTATLGLRDVEAGLPVEPDTLWRIYSMTKPITSVAAMMLWEEGAFELKDPVARFIPAFADARV